MQTPRDRRERRGSNVCHEQVPRSGGGQRLGVVMEPQEELSLFRLLAELDVAATSDAQTCDPLAGRGAGLEPRIAALFEAERERSVIEESARDVRVGVQRELGDRLESPSVQERYAAT